MKHVKLFLLLFVGSLVFAALVFAATFCLGKLAAVIGTNAAGVVMLATICAGVTVAFAVIPWDRVSQRCGEL